MRRGAFTLVEIMIVILIIGVLLSIAVPNFMRSRGLAWQRSCQSNLRQIENMKDVWATETSQPIGAPCALSDLQPAYIKANVICHAGGVYTPNAVGTRPTCSLSTGTWPHQLP